MHSDCCDECDEAAPKVSRGSWVLARRRGPLGSWLGMASDLMQCVAGKSCQDFLQEYTGARDLSEVTFLDLQALL